MDFCLCKCTYLLTNENRSEDHLKRCWDESCGDSDSGTHCILKYLVFSII